MSEIFARHLITSEDWSMGNIEAVLALASKLKAGDAIQWVNECLRRKTVFLFFNRPSTRSRLSFHAAVVEMGGVPMLIEDKDAHQNESWKELSFAMVNYGAAVCIRLMPGKDEPYGAGEAKLREMAAISDETNGAPIISMSHDRCHPCQGMYEFMTFQQALQTQNLAGKRILYMWTRGSRRAPESPTHDSLMMVTRLGMDVTLCRPKGCELAVDVMAICAQNAELNGGGFNVMDEPPTPNGGYDIVYARHWGPPSTGADASSWYCDEQILGDARFIHPMPIERNVEASTGVVEGPRSMLKDLMENKYFLQKAVLASLVRGSGGFK